MPRPSSTRRRSAAAWPSPAARAATGATRRQRPSATCTSGPGRSSSRSCPAARSRRPCSAAGRAAAPCGRQRHWTARTARPRRRRRPAPRRRRDAAFHWKRGGRPRIRVSRHEGWIRVSRLGVEEPSRTSTPPTRVTAEGPGLRFRTHDLTEACGAPELSGGLLCCVSVTIATAVATPSASHSPAGPCQRCPRRRFGRRIK